MPGRAESSSQYRYGFQGQEKDDEIKGQGNSYDFGARIYDPRIGRWLSLDPAQKEYPYASPYCFVLNTPIQAIDPDGKRVYFVAGAGNDVDGWNYVDRFNKIWTEKGIEGFKRVDASRGHLGDMLFSDLWRNNTVVGVPRAGIIHAVDDKMVQIAVNKVLDDLATNPLKDGEQLNLAGYSYGSVLQAHVALALIDQGIQVDNLVLIGSPISDDSSLYKKLLEAQEVGKICNVIRVDIEGDKFSNPSTDTEYLGGTIQNLSNDGPHFDLARPGEEADKKIGEAADQIIEGGVN